MKKQPYSEYIDIKEERKEYGLLCNDKSEKYTHYSDWEDHIIECLAKIDNPKDLYNFKRYCLNRARTTSKTPELFVTCVTFVFAIYLESILDGLPLIAIMILLLFTAYMMISENKRVIMESHFFDDVVEIIEKIEKKV